MEINIIIDQFVMPKYFHYISYLRWVFYIWGLFLIFSQGYYQSDESLGKIGLGIYLVGISLAVGSLADAGALSKKEKKTFGNRKRVKLITITMLSGAGITFVTGLLFILIDTINPNLEPLRAEQYANLGYGCWAMALGMIFELKQMFDRKSLYDRVISGEGLEGWKVEG